MRTTGKQCGLAATGDHQPSLRSPWLVAYVACFVGRQVVAVIFGEQVAQFSLPLFKGIGDILQKDQTQHDVLVVGCVQIVAQLVGSLPELVVEGF